MSITPRKFLAWLFAATIALSTVLIFVLLISDVYYGRFPRLTALTSVSTPLGQALVVAGVAVGVATVLVILLAATRGNLEFSALGLQFRGPSGPLLLWTVVFVAVAAVVIASLTATASSNKAISDARERLNSKKVITFQAGWIFVGYYTEDQGYIEGPNAAVVFRPGLGEQGDLLPKVGDILLVRKERQVIIAGYRSSGLANQMISPALVRSVVTPDDETGVTLEKGKLLITRDVEASHFPDRPFSIWCRVAECDQDTQSCVDAVNGLENSPPVSRNGN